MCLCEVLGTAADTVEDLEWVPETHRNQLLRPGFLATFGAAWLAYAKPGNALAAHHKLPCDGLATVYQCTAGVWLMTAWPSCAVIERGATLSKQNAAMDGRVDGARVQELGR